MDSVAGAAIASPIAGLSVAVVHGRDTLVWKGYGFESLATRRPATPLSVYWAASLVKPLTASAIMRAADARLLSLDDTVGAWLPDAPAATRRVSIRQLLNHTAGTHNVSLVPRWRTEGATPLTPAELVSLVAGDTLDFSPGTKWRYTNTGYILLGMILERATHATFADHLTRTMLLPIGMRSSSVCEGGGGYERKDGTLVPATPLSATRLFSAGAFCTTAGDMLRWAEAFAAGRVVSDARRAEMTTPTGVARTAPIHYGDGMASDSLAGHRRWHHPGGVYGYSAHMAIFPDDSLVVVVMANTGPGLAEALSEQIARAWFAGASPTR